MKLSEVEPFLMVGFTIEDSSCFPVWQYKILTGNLWGRITNSLVYSWGKLEYSYDALKVRENNIWQVPGVDTTKLTRDQAIILMDAGYKVTSYACIDLEGQAAGYYFKSVLNNKIYFKTIRSGITFKPNFFDENRTYKLLDNQPIEKPMNKTFDGLTALYHMHDGKKVTCDLYEEYYFSYDSEESVFVCHYLDGSSRKNNDEWQFDAEEIYKAKWSLYEEPKKELNLSIEHTFFRECIVNLYEDKISYESILLFDKRNKIATLLQKNIEELGYKLKVVD